MNPGPSDSDLSSSFGSISSTSTTVSNFMHNSVFFLHLNIQSITPKLDLITAEYSSVADLEGGVRGVRPLKFAKHMLYNVN